MSRGSTIFQRANKNKVQPVDDLISERIEVSPERFIRVLRYSPTENASSVSTRNDNSSVGRFSKISTSSRDDNDSVIVIFFIHGVGGCAELWNEQLRHFSKAGYAVVAIDLLGHGGSSCPRDEKLYEFSELANDVLAVFDRFARKRNILVGHSYGASFCCFISSIRLRRVSKIILIAGGAPIPLRPEAWSIFGLPISLLMLIKPFLLWSFERRAFYRKHRTKDSNIRAFSAPLFVIKAILQGQKWEAGDETFHNELMVHALLLHGAQDKFVSLEDEKWMQEAIYSSSLEVISESGHMVMLESPEKVNWFIHNFLQRDPTTRSKIASPSREFSKDSIHVKTSQATSTSKRLSLTVESMAEAPVEGTRRRSQSVSLINHSSAVSLNIPGTSGVRSNSLPGSSSDIIIHDKSNNKTVEIQVETSKGHCNKAFDNCDDDKNACTQERRSSSVPSVGRKKGVFEISEASLSNTKT